MAFFLAGLRFAGFLFFTAVFLFAGFLAVFFFAGLRFAGFLLAGLRFAGFLFFTGMGKGGIINVSQNCTVFRNEGKSFKKR